MSELGSILCVLLLIVFAIAIVIMLITKKSGLKSFGLSFFWCGVLIFLYSLLLLPDSGRGWGGLVIVMMWGVSLAFAVIAGICYLCEASINRQQKKSAPPILPGEDAHINQ